MWCRSYQIFCTQRAYGTYRAGCSGIPHLVLKDDNTEVHLLESVDYGDTDLRSVIEGDSRRHHDREEDYGKHGYTKQEFDGEELVDVEEDEDEEDDFNELDEVLEDNDEE